MTNEAPLTVNPTNPGNTVTTGGEDPGNVSPGPSGTVGDTRENRAHTGTPGTLSDASGTLNDTRRFPTRDWDAPEHAGPKNFSIPSGCVNCGVTFEENNLGGTSVTHPTRHGNPISGVVTSAAEATAWLNTTHAQEANPGGESEYVAMRFSREALAALVGVLGDAGHTASVDEYLPGHATLHLSHREQASPNVTYTSAPEDFGRREPHFGAGRTEEANL